MKNPNENTDRSDVQAKRFQHRRAVCIWGGAVILSIVSLLVGSGVNTALTPGYLPYLIVGGAALLLVYLILPLGNHLLAHRFSKSISGRNAEQLQEYVLSHRRDTDKTAREKMAVLSQMRVLAGVTAVLCGLCGLLLGVCMGGLINGGYFRLGNATLSLAIMCLPSLLPFAAALVRIPFRVPEEVVTEDETYITPEQFPRLYGLAHRAADAMGCEGQIRLFLQTGFDAGIARRDKSYDLIIGASLVGMTSEEELYCILLHEFGHMVSEQGGVPPRETAYSDRLWRTWDGVPLASVLSCPYRYPETVFYFQFTMYRYAVSLNAEAEADRRMAELGDPAVAASALIKLGDQALYEWEDMTKDSPCAYASETMTETLFTDELQKLLSAMEQNSDRWHTIHAQEIQARNASHPTLRMRLEALGVSEYRTLPIPQDDPLREERAAALAWLDRMIYDDLKQEYAGTRQTRYLEPLARIEAWEAAGEPLIATEYRDRVDDLRLLGRVSEAEALCDRAIRELPTATAAFAEFMKGQFLLHRMDERGIEHIYRALENNSNFIDEGLETIGKFCCLAGKQEELDRYRTRGLELAQAQMDRYDRLGELKKGDDLSADTLPKGKLEDILSFIHTADVTPLDTDSSTEPLPPCLKRVFLVRKTIAEDFFTSVFILDFKDGTDAERREEVYHRVFSKLDTDEDDWQYSLFEYSDVRGVGVERIPGSCVWEESET